MRFLVYWFDWLKYNAKQHFSYLWFSMKMPKYIRN